MTKASAIDAATRNVEAVRQLLSHASVAATSAYLGIEQAKALDIAKNYKMFWKAYSIINFSNQGSVTVAGADSPPILTKQPANNNVNSGSYFQLASTRAAGTFRKP